MGASRTPFSEATICDPISVGAGVLTLGSMAANSIASDQVASARSGVLSSEAQRQRGFDQETNAFNTSSTNGYDNTQGKMGQRAMQVADFYKSQNGGLPVSGPTTGVIPASSSNIVNTEGKTQQAKVSAFNDQQNGALAKLRSFGDILGGADRNTALNTANVGTINSFKRGDAALVPMQLEEANNAGNGTKLFGDILGGLGKVGMFAGLGPNNPFKQVSDYIPGTGTGLFGTGIFGSPGTTYAEGLRDGIIPV